MRVYYINPEKGMKLAQALDRLDYNWKLDHEKGQFYLSADEVENLPGVDKSTLFAISKYGRARWVTHIEERQYGSYIVPLDTEAGLKFTHEIASKKYGATIGGLGDEALLKKLHDTSLAA